MGIPTNTTLVTGATGLIGTHLVQKLKELGKTTIRTFNGDILNFGEVEKAMQGVDFVYHCAGLISYLKKDKQRLYDVNVEGTKNVLKAVLQNNVKRVVHVSSVSALYPLHDYGLSKSKSESVCLDFLRKGLDVIIARPVKIYGAGDIHGNSLYSFSKIASSTLVFAPPGITSYLHVDDLVDGLVKLMEHGSIGLVYTFTGEQISYTGLYSIIAQEMERSVKIVTLPRVLKTFIKTLGVFSKYDTGIIETSFRNQIFSGDLAEKELHWKPRKTLREMIREMIEFYRAHRMLG